MPSTRPSAIQSAWIADSEVRSVAICRCSENPRWLRMDCTPVMNFAKKTSSPTTSSGRASTRPIACGLRPRSVFAAWLGRQRSSSAICRMRARVASDTPRLPLIASETAPLVTPARSAMWAIVTRPGAGGGDGVDSSATASSLRAVSHTLLGGLDRPDG